MKVVVSRPAEGVQITCFDDRVWQLEQRLTPDIPLHVHLVTGDDRAVLIDTGLASTYPLIGELLTTAGVRPRDVRVIFNTHAHHDHIGSNRRMQADTGALIAAAAGAAPWIEDHARQIREFVFHHPDIIPDTPDVRGDVADTLDGEVRVDILLDEGTRFNLGRNVELQVLSVPGHVKAELAFYERSSASLILGDAVTGIDWAFIHGHFRPSTYRASLAKLQAFAATVPIQQALLAHYPIMDRKQFIELLGRETVYLETLDHTILDTLRQSHDGLDLETIWRAVCKALGKQLEFRGLATVDGHLQELTESGNIARVGPDRYARLGD